MIDIPPMLYKFRDWNCDYHKRIITKNEVYFASPSQFNDPFDRGITMRTNLETELYKRKRGEELLKKSSPHLSSIEIKRIIDKALRERLFDNPKHLMEVTEKTFSKHGIFSLSATLINPLLWSHYAFKHQGFCIGFDYRELTKYFESFFYPEEILIDHIKVEYLKKYPILIPSKFPDDAELMKFAISCKSEDWRYEKEYRYLYLKGAKKTIRLNDNLIKEIILGCDMPIKHREEILKEVAKKNSNIKIYKAVRSFDSFEVKIDPI